MLNTEWSDWWWVGASPSYLLCLTLYPCLFNYLAIFINPWASNWWRELPSSKVDSALIRLSYLTVKISPMKNWPAIDPKRVWGKEPTNLQLAVQHDIATIMWSAIHVVTLGLLLCLQHGFSTYLLTKVACQNPHSLYRSAAWSCSHSLERQCVPKDLVDTMLVPIPKKVCLSNCDNWRGISLLYVVRKPIATILQDRLQQLADEELPDSVWILQGPGVHWHVTCSPASEEDMGAPDKSILPIYLPQN